MNYLVSIIFVFWALVMALINVLVVHDERMALVSYIFCLISVLFLLNGWLVDYGVWDKVRKFKNRLEGL